ncbi:MAG TPA: SHOCT domain-containing protein [Candidatus Saccharibacteria bacterium]|nr:SHOCT domain-containing protein [Candidatus Saccharibacteria bacterium]HMT39624.1 SHOCT domain-containing protein [Candidatus Saccharibacteria bacterium]
MPGLLRGMARTAVIAGTATHVSNNVSRRQARRYAQEDAANAPVQATPEATNTDDQFAQLKQLGELKEQGILTQAEFDAKKAQILGM